MGKRFAVVLKAYAWDGFVERQARRLEAATGPGDFFVSIDETNGSVGTVPFANVERFTKVDLLRSGLADRFEKGSLLWWNPDYAHYQFLAGHDDYDYYVFVEYDALIQRSIAELVDWVARDSVDFVALPVRTPLKDWFWTPTHSQIYPPGELRGSLNCITVFSHRALVKMHVRRMEMAADPTVRFWPIGEVFLPTEIERAGLSHRSLEEFGDVSAYDWYPPTLEEDLPGYAEATFLHPVLDPARYVATVLRSNPPLLSFVLPWSAMHRQLARVRSIDYMRMLPGEFHRRSRGAVAMRWRRVQPWFSAMREQPWTRLARFIRLPAHAKRQLGSPETL